MNTRELIFAYLVLNLLADTRRDQLLPSLTKVTLRYSVHNHCFKNTNMRKVDQLCWEEYGELYTLVYCYEHVHQYNLSEQQFSHSYQHFKSTNSLTQQFHSKQVIL